MKSYIELRVSDNVLDESHWGIIRATVVDGYVTALERAKVGIHVVPAQIEWNLQDMAEWLSYDPTGFHPETYHEIRQGLSNIYLFSHVDNHYPWLDYSGYTKQDIIIKLKRLLEDSAV